MNAKKNLFLALALIVITSMLLSACAAPAAQAPAAEAGGEAAVEETAPTAADTEGGAEDFTTPHPILSDLRVRQAIAYCIDRDALIASVYPYVDDETKPTLRMDSFIPKGHWAYGGPYEPAYEYDPEQGMALLEEAGWTLADGASVRTNANGDPLTIKFTTTNAQFRQTWAAVAEQNLAGCGIQIVRLHVPASWWFGDTTGLARRDFELGAYAWVGQADPSGMTLYACNQIPLPSNEWEGQNYMGWCNQRASDNIVLANFTLEREARATAYNAVQEEFAKDMVSLPVFQRAEAEAWSTNLEGMRVSPTEYATASAADWTLADGGDTVVIGFSQEPASMFTLVESAAVQAQIAQMGIGVTNTQYDYDFQPGLQTELSTVESGLATNEMVPVAAGDTVWTADGEPAELAEGVNVISDNQIVAYDGSNVTELPQLVVTYELKPYTWSDGTPGSIEDVKLAFEINCSRDVGATTFTTCDSIASTEFAEDGSLQFTVTYVPGAQPATYFTLPWGISPNSMIYPSHQVISDGRNLADVPAVEWATLPEIAEMPLSYGPFVITEWQKGQQLTLERNPYYEPGTGVERIVVVFVTDTNQAVAQLLSGDVDYLEKATLGGGAEVQTLIDAAESGGPVNIEIIPSPTWEHIDFNLFTK